MSVALINAHTKYAKGASCEVAGKVYAEYDLSCRINAELIKLLEIENISASIIDSSHITPYTKSLHSKAETVNQIAPLAAIETHFNAGPSVALSKISSGMEIIYADRHGEDSLELAKSCMSSMIDFLPFKVRRGGKGLYKTSKLFILNNIHCPIVISEICFLSNPVDRLYLLHPRSIDVIAQCLKIGIVHFLNGRI